MGIYAYCAVPLQHSLPAGLTGLGSKPVHAIELGEVALWVSEAERPEPGVTAVKEHNAVIEAAVTEAVTPVPLRFGQWLADEAALRQAMAGKTSQYHERLARFAGCLEFGIRLIDPQEPEEARVVHRSEHTSGLEYMRALQESSRLAESKHRRADSVHARITGLMQEIVRDEQVEAGRTAHAFLTLSHLVPRAEFENYRSRAQVIREWYPELRMLLSGPWPPYSFAV